MNRFAELLDRLAYEPARNNKLRLMTEYFRSAGDPERGWALAALTGALSFQHAKPGLIRSLIADRTDPVLFELSYDYVGDLSETAALMWPAPLAQRTPSPLVGYGMQESDSIGIANLIQGLGVHLAGGFAVSFGDIRVAQRADWLVDRIAALGTLVLRRIGETRAGEMAVHGFLSSPYVSVAGIVETAAARTAAQCPVAASWDSDTTEINFAGREKKRRGFGPAAMARQRASSFIR